MATKLTDDICGNWPGSIMDDARPYVFRMAYDAALERILKELPH